MRLANVDGRASLVIHGRVLDVEKASDGKISSDPGVLCDLSLHPKLSDLEASADVSALPALEEKRLGPPAPNPKKIVAVALNYRSHAEESNLTIPDEPHVFGKWCQPTGSFDPIVIPEGRDKIDYEAEIVVAIGRDGKALDPSEVWDHIAGVTCGQDISDRGEQFRPPVRQFTLAKSYDTFAPTGPVIVTPDSLPDRDDLELVCTVDGEEMQRNRSSDLIFPIPELISWLSRFMTFRTGDLVFTGTPGGVGESRSPEVFLHDGMVVETEVSDVGKMRNPCVAG
jgi:2,4-didehydro-3-deoxy-L-rhamnonate hydrolase